MKTRTIAIFTGNRAEYGLQYPIIKAIKNHPKLEYKLLVSGAHLDKNFGNTLDEIKNDGFEVYKQIYINTSGQSNTTTANAIANGILSIVKTIKKIKPDFLLVYGDRFEGFAATIASSQMNIPTAHVEGGDLTEGGTLDDSVRHAMTKLSHLHFTTNKVSTNRILALGEENWRVHTVGLPSIDLIGEKNYAKVDEITRKIDLNLLQPIVILTQHSVTTEFEKSKVQILESIKAMTNLANNGFNIIITYPNNDMGSSEIINEIEILKSKKIKNVHIYKSLGRYLYHGLLSLSMNPKINVVCVGNSSSGIKETPIFSCPCVNIGSRQEGRLRSDNVIDVTYNSDKIIEAVRYSLTNKSFQKKCLNLKNPYYIGGAGKKIAEILANVKLNPQMLRKKMTLQGKEKNGWFR